MFLICIHQFYRESFNTDFNRQLICLVGALNSGVYQFIIINVYTLFQAPYFWPVQNWKVEDTDYGTSHLFRWATDKECC